jgi:hypothetical protein
MAAVRPEWGAGTPPRHHPHWSDIEINWDAGTVFDDFDLSDEGRAAGASEWRILLINRLALSQLWSEPLPVEPFRGHRNPSSMESHANPESVYPDPPWVGRKQARTKQILRFRERQQRRRNWISIADIADWIASNRGATDRRDERLRAQGYDDLLSAILNGEFDRDGRSCVLYLTPDTETFRLQADLLRNMRDFYAGSMTVNEEVLSRCWVQRQLAQRWFERRELLWPKRFDPVEPLMSSSGTPSQAVATISASAMPRPKVPDPEVEIWYGIYRQKAIAQGLRPSEAQDWLAAQTEFGARVRREQVRSLRRKHAPDEWRKQGRRSTTKISADNSAT